MAVSEVSFPRWAEHERDQLRVDLEQRRRGLRTALDLYADTAIEPLPRAALIRSTHVALTEVAQALTLVDAPGYGVCVECGEALSTSMLAVRPLATRCGNCIELTPIVA
jgi:RNA polymerase-binding transcription factor DksA